MLRLFRARACCLITAVLLAAGTTTAAYDELLHAWTSHDVACAPVSDVAHDASSHRVKAPGDPAPHDSHCVGCHLARAPRVGAQPASFAAHCEDVPLVRPVATIGSARAAALDNLPPRSPPQR
jgi:hypothetical protein